LETLRKFMELEESDSVQIFRANAMESILYLGSKSDVYVTPVR